MHSHLFGRSIARRTRNQPPEDPQQDNSEHNPNTKNKTPLLSHVAPSVFLAWITGDSVAAFIRQKTALCGIEEEALRLHVGKTPGRRDIVQSVLDEPHCLAQEST